MISLRRVTTGRGFIPQIDGLRFVAILSVVLFHIHGSLAFGGGAVESPFRFYPQLLSELSKRGVELFFAISGFILALPFASSARLGSPPVNLRSYFWRRVTRLEPPYIVNLCICYLIVVFNFHTPATALFPHFLASVVYLHQLIYNGPSLINAAAWSLEIEIQFYVTVPVLALLFRIANPAVRRGILGAAILISGLLSLFIIGTAAEYSIFYFLNFFLTGFLFCDLYVSRGLTWERPLVLLDIAALLLWPVVWILPFRTAHVLLPLVFLSLFLSVFRGRWSSVVFKWQPFTDIGGMCYSIYLFHLIAIGAAGKLTKPLHLGGSFLGYFGLQLLLLLPIVLGVSVIFFLLIEKPCMDKNWPHKLRDAVLSSRRKAYHA